MQIAVLSDIHGNYIALKACTEEIERRKIRTIIFLGDYLGEMAYPQRTMELLYHMQEKYECYYVRGNKEDYWINHRKNPNTYPWKQISSSTGCLQYVYDNLTSKDIDFFEKMEPVLEISFQDFPSIKACHGSPSKNNEALVLNSEISQKYLEETGRQIILCGHTHVQGLQQLRGKFLINPGSVGMGHLNGPKAQMILLNGNDKKWDYEFINLEYDVDQVFKEMQESELNIFAPAWCGVTKYILNTGNLTHTEAIRTACSFYAKDCDRWDWREIPEKYWGMALEKLRIKLDLY